MSTSTSGSGSGAFAASTFAGAAEVGAAVSAGRELAADKSFSAAGKLKPDPKEIAARFLKALRTRWGAADEMVYPVARETAVRFAAPAAKAARTLSSVMLRTAGEKRALLSRTFLMCILYSKGLILSFSRRAA